MLLTLEGAKEAHTGGRLKEWATTFLRGEGNNRKLAEHIEEYNTWIGLFDYPLSNLRREMGPKEEGLAFSESKEEWERKTDSLRVDIENGYVPPPLIATDFWDDVHLSDGSHRHEALLRAGFTRYWTIFFIKDSSNIKWVEENR